jgi:hypothetical protein
MKLSLSFLAMTVLLSYCSGAAYAGDEWPVETTHAKKPALKFAPPHFADQPFVNHMLFTPPPAAEYRSASQSPYVTEYGYPSSGKPVSAQPPVICPTASTAHIQEFNFVTPEPPAPTFEGGPEYATKKSLRYKHLSHRNHLSRPRAIAYKSPASAELHSPLIPVHVIPDDQLVGPSSGIAR